MGTVFHGKASDDSEAQKKESKSGNCFPGHVLFAIKLDDQFTDDKDNGRINHRVQAKPVNLKIDEKTPEEFNDDEKS